MIKMKSPAGDIVLIPGGAVNSYKNLGFVKVIETKAKEQNEVKQEKTPDELFLKSIVEKPIGEWSKKEVARFLKLKGKQDQLRKEDGTNKTLEEAKKIVIEIINSGE